MSRVIRHRYEDPLDAIWRTLAAELGMRVVRSDGAYASWDGGGTLTVCTSSEFDADDSLAQYVFHEVCHFLVEGPESWSKPDWGLENTDERHLSREHACLRLQAALARPYGLALVLAPTTDARAWYDALPADPLEPGDDPVTRAARHAFQRATAGPIAEPLARALRATAAIAAAVRPFADSDSVWGG